MASATPNEPRYVTMQSKLAENRERLNARTKMPGSRRLLLQWSLCFNADRKQSEWRLMLNVDPPRCVATVWATGVWHTWDEHGTGGENSSEETVARAKIEAAASAIAQGFV